MEFTLVWAAATGVALMWIWVRTTPGIGESVDDPFGTLLGAAMVGLIAGRLSAMAFSGTNPFTHPADILLIRGGVDTGMAAVGALGAMAWMARTNPVPVLDALAAPSLAGLAGWHLGCVWRGACLGTATELPWAVASSGSPIGRHPTELYAAAVLLASAWLLRRAWRAGRLPTGLVGALGLGLASSSRLVTEPLRLSLGAGATGWYVTGSVIGLGAAAVVFLTRRAKGAKPGIPSD